MGRCLLASIRPVEAHFRKKMHPLSISPNFSGYRIFLLAWESVIANLSFVCIANGMRCVSVTKAVVSGWGSPTRRMSFGGSQLASIRLGTTRCLWQRILFPFHPIFWVRDFSFGVGMRYCKPLFRLQGKRNEVRKCDESRGSPYSRYPLHIPF